MKIGTLDVGAGYPCAVICELSNAANGKFENAIKLLDAAKSAGASAAKIQTYLPSEIVALRGDGPAPAPWNDRKMSDLYAQAATPFSWIPKLFDYADDIGLPLFSSVFGPEGLEILEAVGNPCYKIARLDNQNEALAGMVARTNKPMLVSEQFAYESVVVAADKFHLHCAPGYPTPATDVHLPYNFGSSGFFGLSSHCLAPELPIAAVARGAKLLEYHFQLDAEPSELETSISLGETAFATMVRGVRRCEALLA